MWTTGELVKVILIAAAWGGGVIGLIAWARRRARWTPVLFGTEIVALVLMAPAVAIGIVYHHA